MLINAYGFYASLQATVGLTKICLIYIQAHIMGKYSHPEDKKGVMRQGDHSKAI